MNALLLLGKNEHSYTLCAELSERTNFWRACLDVVELTDVLAWNPDVIISYNYRHIVAPDILAIPKLGAWNLHPAMLPLGRGAHPIFWALAEGQPAGVTVHEMNAGLDTGPILGQVPVVPRLGDSLKSLYDHAHLVLRALFWAHWEKIARGTAREWTRPQTGPSTYHRAAHLERYWPKLPQGWDTPVEVVQELGLEHGTAHG